MVDLTTPLISMENGSRKGARGVDYGLVRQNNLRDENPSSNNNESDELLEHVPEIVIDEGKTKEEDANFNVSRYSCSQIWRFHFEPIEIFWILNMFC